jgi:hypothetical protein
LAIFVLARIWLYDSVPALLNFGAVATLSLAVSGLAVWLAMGALIFRRISKQIRSHHGLSEIRYLGNGRFSGYRFKRGEKPLLISGQYVYYGAEVEIWIDPPV